MASTCTKIRNKIQAPKLDVDDEGKAKSFQMFSIARPYMRGFHTSWFCFFMAFTSWFGIQPLIPTIRKEFGLTKREIAYSGIASISATLVVRIVAGRFCDRFGPRRVMSVILCVGAIPLAFSGLIQGGTGLIIVRLFIGILGGAFVPCQFWTSAMFNKKIVGSANALVGGWGNLGGGFTFLLMPVIFIAVQSIVGDEFLAWKIAVLIPALVVFGLGIMILWTSDDCPQGHWSKRKLITTTYDTKEIEPLNDKPLEFKNLKSTGDVEVVLTDDIPIKTKQGSPESELTGKIWVWICVAVLMMQYGLAFGIEIAVNTVMNLYLLYNFKHEGCIEVTSLNSPSLNLTTDNSLPDVRPTDIPNGCSILNPNTASLITSLFGLMNLFARAFGGVFSDVIRKRFSSDLKGRILAHFVCLLMEGILLIVFSFMRNLPLAVLFMVLFSLFCQMSEGTSFSIVPYVNPKRVGLISGLVGAGGNAGAMIWNTIWSKMVDTNPSAWFLTLGLCVIAGSMFCFVLLKLDKHTRK